MNDTLCYTMCSVGDRIKYQLFNNSSPGGALGTRTAITGAFCIYQ